MIPTIRVYFFLCKSLKCLSSFQAGRCRNYENYVKYYDRYNLNKGEMEKLIMAMMIVVNVGLRAGAYSGGSEEA
jgi:hypothetical protein